MGEEDFVVVNYKGTVDGNPITDIVKVARGITEQANAWLHLKRNPLVPGPSRRSSEEPRATRKPSM